MQVILFLLDTVFFLLIAACLLRMWMNGLRIRMAQQPGPFVMALTNWLVIPLRRLLPRTVAQSNFDVASLLAALLFACAYAIATWLVVVGMSGTGLSGTALWMVLPVWALKVLVRSALQGIMLMAFVFAILSWVQPQSSAHGMLARLVDPLLRPLRRVIPTIGGVDLSVLVLIVLAQIGLILLG